MGNYGFRGSDRGWRGSGIRGDFRGVSGVCTGAYTPYGNSVPLYALGWYIRIVQCTYPTLVWLRTDPPLPVQGKPCDEPTTYGLLYQELRNAVHSSSRRVNAGGVYI